jgi:hypothetical protein
VRGEGDVRPKSPGFLPPSAEERDPVFPTAISDGVDTTRWKGERGQGGDHVEVGACAQ